MRPGKLCTYLAHEAGKAVHVRRLWGRESCARTSLMRLEKLCTYLAHEAGKAKRWLLLNLLVAQFFIEEIYRQEIFPKIARKKEIYSKCLHSQERRCIAITYKQLRLYKIAVQPI